MPGDLFGPVDGVDDDLDDDDDDWDEETNDLLYSSTASRGRRRVLS